MNDELVQYFLVNKDMGMGKGKIAGQVAHAACIYTYATLMNTHRSDVYKEQIENFHKWYSHIQKKIILKAPQSLLEQLEAEGYIAIRDKGYTQIEPNSLTVVTLGVNSRESVKSIVENLPLL